MPNNVTIGSDTFTVYGTLAEADTYLNGKFGIGTTWTALPEDDRERALVQASDVLDLLTWQGARLVATQERSFPRTGLPTCDGVVQSDSDDPTRIEEATYELAYLVSQSQFSTTVSATQAKNAANIKRVKAGSAEVEFQRPLDVQSFQSAADLPPLVRALVSCLLSSSLTTAPAETFGNTAVSQFDDCDRYDVNEGFH